MKLFKNYQSKKELKRKIGALEARNNEILREYLCPQVLPTVDEYSVEKLFFEKMIPGRKIFDVLESDALMKETLNAFRDMLDDFIEYKTEYDDYHDCMRVLGVLRVLRRKQ